MTPIRALDEPYLERKDLPEYEIEVRCANPHCADRADDRHEIVPRSQTAGVAWWVELPGRFLLGNRIGLCREHHRRTDSHADGIIWDEENSVWAYVDFTERWAEPLSPMPPIHRLEEPGLVVEPIPPAAIDVPESEPEPEPELESGPEERSAIAEPEVTPQEVAADPMDSEVALLARRIRATDAYLREIEEGSGLAQTGEHVPPRGEPDQQAPDSENVPVPPSLPVLEEEPPQDRLYVDGERILEPLEPLEPAPPPVPVIVEPDPDVRDTETKAGFREKGDDAKTVAEAIRAARAAQERAEASMKTVPESGTLYRADLTISPESYETEVIAGDVRAKLLVDELADRAKKAPRPKEKPVPDDPDREREPATARRTWSIGVPAKARDEGKVALGEDGYNLIEDALELARERIGMYETNVRSWKFLTLLQVLIWFNTNYDSSGED